MTKRAKIFWGLGAVLGVPCLIVAGLAVYVLYSERNIIMPAVSYQPACRASDAPCAAWTAFRRKHPYPYQTVAVGQLPDATRIVILSEPSPIMTPSALRDLTTATFGADIVSSRRLRWYIGIDGWVEDLVLTVRAPSASIPDPLRDPVLRDRVALLHHALFGTNFGGDIETLDDEPSLAEAHLSPNLHVSPREVNTWLADNSRHWQPLDEEDPAESSWAAICQRGAVGAFASGDHTLIMLTFPTSLLTAARLNPIALAALRNPFREFAVASDDVFGGVWAIHGQAAILARVRTRPLDQLPPLRFETFVLLATQSADELSQSYERNTVFAGKLQSGPYNQRDWAPVYLSAPLIDTELGALLNITDQMLKSWSEAGAIEYLYFSYPKPSQYPFTTAKGNRPSALSDVLQKTFGQGSVLFNWNTAGSAVVLRSAVFSTLAPKQTGALPVTYGAEGRAKKSGEQDLFDYEERAYRYFAGLGDPNLGRVVQYTLLYQLFRAMAKDNPAADRGTSVVPEINARSKATALLIRETSALLNDFDAGSLPRQSKAFTEQLASRLRSFRGEHPDFDNARLAGVLVNRFSPDSNALLSAYVAQREKVRAELVAEQNTLHGDIDRYNLLTRLPGSPSETVTREELTRRQAELDSKVQEFEKSTEPMDAIRQSVYALASETRDLDRIRREYIELNNVDPRDSIKTPSVVLSWNTREGLFSVGGHNVDSRALRLEKSDAVSGLSIVTNADGEVTALRYNPSISDSVEANASELARAIEHRGERDPAALAKLIEEPAVVRPPREALELAATPVKTDAKKEFGHLGNRVYAERTAFVGDLNAIAEKNACCVFVARDADQNTFIAERNANAPPPVLTWEARDTPSLVDRLALISNRAGTKSEKAVIFFDEPSAHVQALTLGLSHGIEDSTATATMAASLRDPAGAEGSQRVSAIVQRDLEGRNSVIRTLKNSLQGPARDLLERLGVVQPRESWHAARLVELDTRSLEAILQNAGWDNSRDGLPTAIKISFGSGGGERPPDVSVVAGFSPEHAPLGKASLIASHDDAVLRAQVDGGSIAQYMMTVRNRLKTMPASQLKRLILVAHDDAETRTLFTLMRRSVENASSD